MSYSTLQSMTRLRRQSLSDTLKRLENNPCLSVTKGTRQRANRYEIRIAPVPGCDRICCNWEGRRAAQLGLSLVTVVDPEKKPEVVKEGDHQVVNDVDQVVRTGDQVVRTGDHVVRTGDHGGPDGGLDPSDPSGSVPLSEKRSDPGTPAPVCVGTSPSEGHAHTPPHAHRRHHLHFCKAIDPAMVCLDQEHVEELLDAVQGFPRDQVLREFRVFVYVWVKEHPGTYPANIFERGREFYQMWTQDGGKTEQRWRAEEWMRKDYFEPAGKQAG